MITSLSSASTSNINFYTNAMSAYFKYQLLIINIILWVIVNESVHKRQNWCIYNKKSYFEKWYKHFFSLFEKWKLLGGLDYTGQDANRNDDAILTTFLIILSDLLPISPFYFLFLDQTFPKYFPNGSAWLLFYFIFEWNF